jgi:hypothetical protein
MHVFTYLVGVTVTIPRICAGWPDCPRQAAQTKAWGVACMATQQKRYNKSTFLAHLAEALQ